MKRFLLAATLLFALVLPASALDLNTYLTGIDGAVLKDKDAPNGITIRALIINALLASYEDDSKAPIEKMKEDKLRRFRLAERVYKDEAIDLSAEEIALIKECVVKGYPPLIMARIFSVIDPASMKQK